ncbi:hypothetical protein Tco_0606650 [Tanacetum coccineum]
MLFTPLYGFTYMTTIDNRQHNPPLQPERLPQRSLFSSSSPDSPPPPSVVVVERSCGVNAQGCNGGCCLLRRTLVQRIENEAKQRLSVKISKPLRVFQDQDEVGPCYNQDSGYNQSPYYSPSQSQQFDCCEVCGGPHFSSDCQTGNTPIYDQGPCYNQNYSDDQLLFYSSDHQQKFDYYEVCGGPHYCSDSQTRNQLVHEPSPAKENNRILEEILRTHMPNSPVVPKEPEGSNDYTEVMYDEEQFLKQQSIAPVTPPPLAYTPPPSVLAAMEPLDTILMGDEVISTITARGIDEFIKSSVDGLVPILRESELTLVNLDLECREQIDTLSMGDKEIDFNPSRDIEELEHLLSFDPVPVPREFDEPLGHSDLISRSFYVTFSNSLFDFNDDL